MKKIFLVLSLLMTFFVANAQPGIGCLRNSDGLLYSQKNGFGFYELLGSRYSTAPNNCPRVVLGAKTGVTCRFILGGPANDEYNYVLYTANGPVQCDLDHYAYGFVLVAGVFVFRRMRRA